MGKPQLTLYVDIISPFAYMGFWLTRNSPAFSGIQTTYIPILLGGLMQSTGNTPPLNIKNKDKWIEIERKRWAKAFNIPISSTSPNPFPQSTVNTQRALTYISLHHADKLPVAIEALYKAFWIEGKTIGKAEVIKEALEGVFDGSVVKEVLEGLGKDETKKALKENTEGAFKDGAFGLPWFVATNSKGETEGFWGVDHVGQVLEFLGVETKGQGGYKAML